jgi:hypothetical protein
MAEHERRMISVRARLLSGLKSAVASSSVAIAVRG